MNRFAENNQATDVCEVIEIKSSRDGVLERGEQTLTVRKLSQITTGWIFPCGNCFPVNRVGRRMVKRPLKRGGLSIPASPDRGGILYVRVGRGPL